MSSITRILLLLYLYFCGAMLYGQSFDQFLDRLYDMEEVNDQLEYIDQAFENEIFSTYPDTLALVLIEKSYLLFRNNISIQKAIASLDEGLELIDRDRHLDTWIELWYYKGYWYRKWDKYNEAKDALNKVLDIKDDNPRLWDATIQLGKTYKDRGDFALALDTYDTALELAGDNKSELATTYEVISFVYLIMESEEGARQAIPWLEKLIPLLKTMEDEEHFHASMVYNLGTAYHALEDLDRAEYYYQQSEELIAKCCDDESFRSLLLESRALILSDQGKYDEALEVFEESIEFYEESFDLSRSDGLAGTYNKIAGIHQSKGDAQKALEYIDKALGYRLAGVDPEEENVNLSIERLRSNGEKHYLIDDLLTKATILKEQYDDIEDLNFLKRALEELKHCDLLVDFMRFEQIEESSKLFWREKTNEVYDLLIEVNYLLKKYEDAFHYSEKSKYLLTGEHLVQKNTDFDNNTIPEKLLEEYSNLQSDIDNAILNLRDLEVGDKEHQLDSLEIVINDLRKYQDDLLITIRNDYPKYYKENFTFSVSTIEDIRSDILNKDQLLVEFYINDEDLYTFSVSENDFTVMQTSNGITLLDQVTALRDNVLSPDRMDPERIEEYIILAHSIYTNTIGAIDHSSYDDIIIINDDILSLIPFSILLTEQPIDYKITQLSDLPYLTKSKNISYLQSASLLLHLDNNRKRKDNILLACRPSFGESDASTDEFRASLEPLYGAEKELEHLKESISGEFLENNDASEAQIKSALSSEYAIIHLASHAVVDNHKPEYSRLVLHGDLEEDGYLHAYEIQQMDINTDLIVLSACNTGYGKLEKGEGINSLGNAFVRAGSPNLLTSLWPVSDKSTAGLMTRFYDQLASGNSIKNSLYSSQLDFCKTMPSTLQHPFYWGGFVYYGDNRTIDMKENSISQGIVLGILGVVFFGLFTFWRKQQS